MHGNPRMWRENSWRSAYRASHMACPKERVVTLVVWCCAALITLFTPFEYLSDATSISTLFSFFLVAASLLWRRYYGQGGHERGANPWLPAAHLFWLILSAAGNPSDQLPRSTWRLPS